LLEIKALLKHSISYVSRQQLLYNETKKLTLLLVKNLAKNTM